MNATLEKQNRQLQELVRNKLLLLQRANQQINESHKVQQNKNLYQNCSSDEKQRIAQVMSNVDEIQRKAYKNRLNIAQANSNIQQQYKQIKEIDKNIDIVLKNPYAKVDFIISKKQKTSQRSEKPQEPAPKQDPVLQEPRTEKPNFIHRNIRLMKKWNQIRNDYDKKNIKIRDDENSFLTFIRKAFNEEQQSVEPQNEQKIPQIRQRKIMSSQNKLRSTSGRFNYYRQADQSHTNDTLKDSNQNSIKLNQSTKLSLVQKLQSPYLTGSYNVRSKPQRMNYRNSKENSFSLFH